MMLHPEKCALLALGLALAAFTGYEFPGLSSNAVDRQCFEANRFARVVHESDRCLLVRFPGDARLMWVR